MEPVRELELPSAKRHDWLVLLLLAISLTANVALTILWRENTTVRVAYTGSPAAYKFPKVGTRLDKLRLVRSDGLMQDLSFGNEQQPLVVYVLSPICKWCELNRPEIDSLATQISGKYRIIGISRTADGLAAYVAEKSPKFPIYSVDLGSGGDIIPLGATPATLVFSPQGTFVRGSTGAFIADEKKQIASYFAVSLP